jgi:hypothetical protein
MDVITAEKTCTAAVRRVVEEVVADALVALLDAAVHAVNTTRNFGVPSHDLGHVSRTCTMGFKMRGICSRASDINGRAQTV